MAHRLIITGMVQGVFCRNYCRQYARYRGIGGSASNLPDGTVEVLLATDDREAVKAYVTDLESNPREFRFYGRIEGVTVSPWSGDYSGDYLF